MSDDCKRCSRCGEEKLKDDFPTDRKSKDGKSSWCRVCHRARNNARYQANKQDINTKRKSDTAYRIRSILSEAERRAERKGLPFDLTFDDIKVPDVCPVLGIPLRFGEAAGPSDNSPSLDRIIPSKGYVRGNVIVVSMKANRIKNDASIVEIEAVLTFYKELLNGTRTPKH